MVDAGRRDRHRGSFGIIQRGQTATEDTAGVQAHGVVQPFRGRHRGVAVQDDGPAPVLLRPRVAHRQAVAETALVLCGERGAAADGNAAGAVQEFLVTRCLSIAGGTSQILLSLVGERVLGLPREEVR